MQYVIPAMLTAGVAWLIYVWRATRSVPPGASVGSPAHVAEQLVWCDGDLSPNGRRVLWVAPAVDALRSAAKGGEAAAYFAAGCPVDEGALATRLPDDAVKEKVAWPLDAAALGRVREGFKPETLDDKWRIVTLRVDGGERVFLLRSWTGALHYVLGLSDDGVRWVWRGARDPLGVPIAASIVEGYLLRRTCVVPAPREFGEEKLRLMMWGIQIAGRRCHAVEPCVEP